MSLPLLTKELAPKDPPEGTKSRLANHFLVTLGGQVCIIGLGAVTGVLSARLLGPQGRGELAALTLWPMLLVFLSGMGINASVAYHTGKRRYSLSQIWTSSLVIGAMLSTCALLAGFAVIPLVLRHYTFEVRILAYLFLAAVPVVWFGGLPSSFMQGTLNMMTYSSLRAIAPFVFAVGLGILYWLHRASLRDVVLCQMLGFALALAAGIYLLLSKLDIGWSWDEHACWSLVKYGCKTHLGNMSSYVNRSADQLILSLFVAPRELGLYAVAVTMAGAVSFLPQAAGIVTMAKGSNSSPAEARRVITYSFRVSLLWLIVACCGLFIIAPYAIRLLFGAPFAGSVAACRILLPGMVAVGLNQILFEGARAFNQPELPSYTEGFATVVTIIGLYLLLPRFGFLGAAIASTLAYVSSFVFMLALCRSRMQLGPMRLLGFSSSPVQDEHAY